MPSEKKQEEGAPVCSHLRRRLTLVCRPGVKEHPCYPNMMPRFDAPGDEAASNNCKTCRVKPAVTIPGNSQHGEEMPGLFTLILICNIIKLES